MQATEWGPWIRDCRERRGQSQDEFAGVLRGNMGPNARVDGHQVGRWERGEHVPHPIYRAALRAELGVPPWESGAPPQRTTPRSPACGKLSPVDRRAFLAAAAGLAGELTAPQIRRLLEAVARDSSSRAGAVGLTNIGTGAVEQMHADVRRISVDYVTEPALQVFARMVETSDAIEDLLQGHQRPSQTADLTLLAGAVECMLSAATLDLGDPRSAEDHARAAFVYGETIGHPELRAWARAFESCAARHGGRLHQSYALARAGQAYVRGGDVLARLYDLEARAGAVLGEPGAVDRSQMAFEVRLQGGSSDMGTGLGGEFGVSNARLAYGAGASRLAAGDWETARQMSALALQQYEAHPPEDRSYGCIALARINLATAHLQDGEIGGATAALAGVLDMPSGQQLSLYGEGLATIAGLLAEPSRAGREAAALTERIETFRSELPPALTA